MASTSAAIPLWLGLEPARLRMAARTATAAAISLCLVLIYRFPYGYWALITCLIMTQPSVGASMEKGVVRIVATIGASILAVMVLAPLNQDPLRFLALIFAIVAVGAYLGTGTVQPYAFVMGGITLVMVSALGFSGQNAAVQAGIARSGEIIVGVVVSWITAYAVWPTRASVELEARIETTARGLASAYQRLSDAFLESRSPPAAAASRLDAVGATIRQLVALIPPATRESRAVYRQAPAYRALAVHFERLRAALGPLSQFGALPSPEYLDHLRTELRSLTAAIGRGFDSLATAPEDFAVPISLEIAAARDAVAATHDAVRRRGLTRPYPTDQILTLDAFLGSLRELESSLGAAARIRLELREGVARGDVSAPSGASVASWLRVDARRAKYAIKSGVAVVCAVLLLNLLQWESGLDAMVTTFVVTQLTVGGTIRKAMLRFAGALTGGLLALAVILFVVPMIVTLQSFTIVVASVLFVCAYVYTGPERSAYAGFQAGLAFVMVLVASARQELSIMPAVYRLIGVMLGVGISITVESLLWPQHAHLELRERVNTLLIGLAALYADLATALRGDTPRRADWKTRVHALREVVDACSALLGEALLEGRAARARVARDLPIASMGEEILHRLSRLANRLGPPIDPRFFAEFPGYTVLVNAVEGALARLPDRVAGAREVTGDAGVLAAARDALLAQIERARAELRLREFPTEDVESFFALVEGLGHLAEALLTLEAQLAEATERSA